MIPSVRRIFATFLLLLLLLLLLAAAVLLATGCGTTDVASSGVSSAASARIAPNGLAYSTASADVMQDQPPAGACRARGSGLYSEPDLHCTPGALNPAVTQATIRSAEHTPDLQSLR